MKQTIYIVANRTGVARLTKRAPYLDRGELGVAIRLEIPDDCFKNPMLSVDLNVPEGHVMQPTLTLETIEQAHDLDADASQAAEAPDGQAGAG